MKEDAKSIDALLTSDLEAFPVWRYAASDTDGNINVRPIRKFPVSSLGGKLIGSRVMLANDATCWAIIGNIDLRNEELSRHYMTISLERCGRWFGLARYFDFDIDERGPSALAKFLDLRVEEVFPIKYDIRLFVRSKSVILSGFIPEKPENVLSFEEIINLAVPNDV